jgi:hypothetical protein
MSVSDKLVYGCIEGIGILIGLNLWIRRRGTLRRRLVWSLFLFLPIVGPVLYLLTQPFPDEHSDETTVDGVTAASNDYPNDPTS